MAIETNNSNKNAGTGSTGVYTPAIDQLILTNAIGEATNIFFQTVMFVIFEDIFSPVLTGEILIQDNIGMFDNFPISGNETITVKFRSESYDKSNTPVNSIFRTFDVLKVENITEINDYTKRYSLSFASPELKKNETIQISKGYYNETISSLVKKIMTNNYEGGSEDPSGLGFPTTDNTFPQVRSAFLTTPHIEANYLQSDQRNCVELFVERTLFQEDKISFPYMKPFELIKWLSTMAIREARGDTQKNPANFLFFENKRGFQFVSLDTLIEQKNDASSVVTFKGGSAAQNTSISPGIQYYRIESLQIENCYDIIKNIKRGAYASQHQTYDLLTGEVTTTLYNYLDNFNTSQTLDRTSSDKSANFPQILVDENGTNSLMNKHMSRRMLTVLPAGRDADNITSSPTNRYNGALTKVGQEAYIQDRIAQIEKFANFRVTLEIAGNTQHKVGDVINLEIKSWTEDDKGTVKTQDSKYYSGNYLITAIKHVVTVDNYSMIIECVKDSLKSKIGK